LALIRNAGIGRMMWWIILRRRRHPCAAPAQLIVRMGVAPRALLRKRVFLIPSRGWTIRR